MSNKKYVEIALDKPRRLLLDFNAMSKFEDVTGKSFFEWTQNMSRMTAKEFRAFLWACLAHEDSELTVEQVGGMINAGNLLCIQEALAKVQTDNSPEPEPKKDGEASFPLEGSRSESLTSGQSEGMISDSQKMSSGG